MMLVPVVAVVALLNSSALGGPPQDIPEAQSGEGQERIGDLPLLVSLTRETQDFRPGDRFSAPQDQTSWAGQRFRVELPVRDHPFFGWSYDAADQSLLIRVEATHLSPAIIWVRLRSEGTAAITRDTSSTGSGGIGAPIVDQTRSASGRRSERLR